jgi:hypothetical protein
MRKSSKNASKCFFEASNGVEARRTSGGVMKRAVCVFACTVGIVVLVSFTAAAQSTAQINGIVKDSSGGVLPGADVSATQADTNVKRSTVTDAEGAYTLENLPWVRIASRSRSQGSARTPRRASCCRSMPTR